MPDLPRILAKPEGLKEARNIHLPRVSPNAYGAQAFAIIGQLAEESRKQQQVVDLDKAIDTYESGVDQIKTEVSGELDDITRREPQYRLAESRLKENILKDMGDFVTKRAFESHVSKSNIRNLKEVRLEALKVGNSQRIAYADRAADEYSRQIAESSDPARQADLLGRYEGILGGLSSGAAPAITPERAEIMRQQFNRSLEAAHAQTYAGLNETGINPLINRAFDDPYSAPAIEKEVAERLRRAAGGFIPEKKLEADVANATNLIYESAARGIIEKDPNRAKALLDSGIYNDKIKPHTLHSLRNEAKAGIDEIKRKAEAERRAFEKIVGKEVDDYKAAVTAGFPWAGNVAALRNKVRGSEHEAEFIQATKDAGELYLFNQMAPAEQENYLRLLSQKPKTGDDAKLYAKLEAAQQATKTQLKADPITFAMRRRVIPALNPFDISDPASMQERTIAATLVEQRYKLGTLSPLSDDEGNQLKIQLEQSPADGKVGIYRKLQQGFGDDRTKAIAAQLAGKKDSMLALTMGLSVEAPRAASDILRGQEILTNDPKLGLTGAELTAARDRINRNLGEAYSGNVELHATMIDAALAVYTQKSWQSKDLSGVFDSTRMDESVDEVTGGLITIGGGMFRRGYKIQPPRYGMTEADFKDLLGKADYSAAKGVTKKDIVTSGVFQSIGDGRYLVRIGPGYVQTAKGPFVLDLGAVMKSLGGTANIGAAAAQAGIAASIVKPEY